MPAATYKEIADGVAAQIAAGALRPGQRLPPQRAFAFQRGVAVSTVTRAYAELVKRGLVAGEVGRGTYVRSAPPEPVIALGEPASLAVDLTLNRPSTAGQAERLGASLAELVRRPSALADALAPVGSSGSPHARRVAADFLRTATWAPDPESFLFAGNGKQAIAGVVNGLRAAGSRLGVEALTYPFVLPLAEAAGLELAPIPMDADGMTPAGLRQAHADRPLTAIYLQPSVQNPLGSTMPPARRRELASLISALGVVAIEDRVNAFLSDAEPLAGLAPDRCIVIDSLSKRLSAGLTIGMIAAPAALRPRIARALMAGAWTAGGFALAAATAWMADGAAEEIAVLKRADAGRRQALARAMLGDLAAPCDPASYHLWLTLPEPWRAEAFVAAAARHGVAVVGAGSFAAAAGNAPRAVRVGLSGPTLPVLERALKMLRALADADPWMLDQPS